MKPQVMSPLLKRHSSLTWSWTTYLRRSSKNSFLKRLLDSSQDTDLKLVRTRAQRTGRVQMSVSPQFFTLVLSSARLSLPTLDSFEPFRGAVSGSSSFYTFTEFLQSREFWQQAVQQCALSMHLTAYCCLVTNCFLV